MGAQDAGGRRQERPRVGSQAEQSALMLQYWCLGSCWLRGPSGDNSHDQRGHGTGRGGGDGMGSNKNVACLCLCSLPFFHRVKVINSWCTFKNNVAKKHVGSNH